MLRHKFDATTLHPGFYVIYHVIKYFLHTYSTYSTYIHTLHYITLHYITLHSIPFHSIPFHYITLHYIHTLCWNNVNNYVLVWYTMSYYLTIVIMSRARTRISLMGGREGEAARWYSDYCFFVLHKVITSLVILMMSRIIVGIIVGHSYVQYNLYLKFVTRAIVWLAENSYCSTHLPASVSHLLAIHLKIATFFSAVWDAVIHHLPLINHRLTID